ncbi:hypothetical protein [Paenibacillus camerounensis]|uniref:hypothetical protein n=1 Tax=Paenibacillus camerounensis TaxID=1243663 RepID=UPI000A3EFCDB|nr:hypothetical protein [Paenibacillus camerounensis]
MNTYKNAFSINNSFENLMHPENPCLYSVSLSSLEHNLVSAADYLLTAPLFTGSRNT